MLTDMKTGDHALLPADISRELAITARLKGPILEINDAWSRILGWGLPDLQTREYLELVHADDRRQTSDAFAFASAERVPIEVVNRFRHQDGSYKLISWRAVVVKEVLHASGLEVTAGPDTTQALLESQEALRQMQKMEAVGQLTGNIAHDLNNHLQNVVSALELTRRLMASGRGAETERFITSAIGAAQSAASLTQRVRGFARRQPLKPEPLAMGEVIGAMGDLLRGAVSHSVRLDVDVSEDLQSCICDRSEAEAAILNLLINAREAMPDGGTIVLRARNAVAAGGEDSTGQGTAPQYVCVEVIDWGKGMTKQVIAQAFDPFFTTKPAGLGAGLGLTMVQRFALRNGGVVKITSALDKGTAVALYLPIAST